MKLNPFSTIVQLKNLLNNGDLKAAEMQAFFQDRLRRYNGQLNAATQIFDQPQGNLNAQGLESKLAGIPGIAKDNFCRHDGVSSGGSNILLNFHPGYDATVVERIKGHGGTFIASGNMDEFGMGGSGQFSAFGPAKNPWNLACSPGGSSSGVAAAVAAGLVPWGLGTETGGSIRMPAAFCGLVGMYPTYGLLSRYGLMAFGSSLDQPGVITRTVQDNALLLSVMSGHDPKDSTNLPEPKYDFTKKLGNRLPKDFTVGVIKDAETMEGIDPEIRDSFRQAVKELEKLGAKVKTIDIAELKYGIAVYFIISRAEAASNLARIDGSLYGERIETTSLEEMYDLTRSQGFGIEVKRRILLGNYALSASHKNLYQQANFVRTRIRAALEHALSQVDLLISPTTPQTAYTLGKDVEDPLAMYMADYFLLPNCVAGYPALSLPCGFTKAGMPIGMQFIGPRLSEELILQVAHVYEQHMGLWQATPAGYED